MDIGKQLEDWSREIDKAVPDEDTQKKMTDAGGEVLKQKLAATARQKHYQGNRQVGKVKHLADSVDTMADGHDTLVGFEGIESGINHARVARFTNDGTKKMRGDHWVDNTLDSAKDEVFDAMQKVMGSDD